MNEYGILELQTILDTYEGIREIWKHHLFESGFDNPNYFVETHSGKYVVKIFEAHGMSEANIRFEVEVMDFCSRAGLKVPGVLRTKTGSLTTTCQKTLSIVTPYVEGNNADNSELPDRIAREVGEEAGKMDSTLSSFKDNGLTRQQYEFDLKNFLQLEAAVTLISDPSERKTVAAVFERFRTIKPLFDTSPKGLIHNDIVLHNLIIARGTLAAIVDFTDIAFSPYIQNIAVSLCELFFKENWKPHQVPIFLEAYMRHRPLSAEEFSLLYDLISARYVTWMSTALLWDKKFGADPRRMVEKTVHWDLLQRFLSDEQRKLQ